MTHHLANLALRRPKSVVAAWVLVLVLGVVAAGNLFATLDADLDGAKSLESEQVGDRLRRLDPDGGDVLAVVDGAPVADAVLDDLRTRRGVESVAALPSDDGGATGIAVTLAAGLGDDAHESLVDDVASRLRAIDAPEVIVGGEQLLDDEVSALAERDAQRAEAISLPITLVVLAIVVGGALAAGLPLAIALGGVAATSLALTVAAAVTDVSLYALNVTIMLGLGLGIDYGLLLVSRFRDERATGLDVPSAVRRTATTAGRTVTFSALTVAVALLGLLVIDNPTIRSLAIAGIAVVLTSMLAALTLLPALLALVGHRLKAQAAPVGGGWFARLARFTQRRAVPVVVFVGVGLVLLAAPFAGARFDDIGVHALPRSSETRAVAEAVDARFPGVTAEPVEVVADVDPDDPRLQDWVTDVTRLDGVEGAIVSDVSRPGTSVVEVRAAGETNGRTAQAVVDAVRDLDAPFPVAVGGDPAEIVDLRASIADRLPLAAVVVVGATFVLLFLMTGSVVVPIKAIAMNVLSLGATLGALVWVFQEGHLSGLLGFDPPGSLDLAMPLVVFVFAFGLSMDYEVFLLARIREAWLECRDNDRAVALGLQRSGRIITSAALLIVIVLSGFVAGEIVAVKELGLGLALAVVVDATVVRMLLVPATMKLMGHLNWWAPAPLARLHARIGLHEAPAGATAATAAVAGPNGVPRTV